MIRVSEDLLNKIIYSSGLFPVKGSWKKTTQREYDKWSGVTSAYYRYEIKARTFDPNDNDFIKIVGEKESSYDVTFEIVQTTKKQSNDVSCLVKKIKENGLQCEVRIDYDHNLFDKVVKRINQKNIFTSDLEKIIELLGE
jgi:hypothetical protein